MRKVLFSLILLLIMVIGVKMIQTDEFNWRDVNQIKETIRSESNKAVSKLQAASNGFLDDATEQIRNIENAPKPVIPGQILLDVPFLNQMDQPKLRNGCEVTSLAMILKYHGVNVTKNELAQKIHTVPFTYGNGKKGNPHVGFVGDMANGPGLGVYNEPVLELAKKYVGDKAVNLTNHSFDDVLKKVGQGLPVWIITTTSFAPVSEFQTWDTPQGKIDITYSEHSAAITGYDESYIYVNDPYGEKNKKVNRENFIKAWEQMGKQAIVIEK